METTTIETIDTARLRAADLAHVLGNVPSAHLCTTTTHGRMAVRLADAAPAYQGTRVSTSAPTSVRTSVLDAISAVPMTDVVFKGFAGFRHWSPPL